MIRLMLATTALALLSACGDGQPFPDPATTGDPTTTPDPTTDPTEGDGGSLGNDGATPPPPGTDSPQPDQGIFRYEARNDLGGGLVTEVSYNSATDTFTVDNLGFDGANVYQRAPGSLKTLGVTRVFVADKVTTDPVSGKPVGQIVPYSALYGVSKNRVDGEPRTSFAVVRTGGYSGYGFGGYVYERNGGVVIPTTGQATFSGKYAGLRVYDNASGLNYTTGDMTVDVDFEDFNANSAVKGQIINRQMYDEDGVPITTDLPNVGWVVQEGTPTLTKNGEIQSELFSTVVVDGKVEQYETGTFNGIMAGDATAAPGGEIVGVVTLETVDADDAGIKAQETGGVILYR